MNLWQLLGFGLLVLWLIVLFTEPPRRGGLRLLFLLGFLWHPNALAQATPDGPDLSIPAWRLCAAPAGLTGIPQGTQLACYTQDDVRQILRVQEHARYALRLQELQLQLSDRTAALIAELEAAQRSYEALRTVIEERNGQLNDRLRAAEAATERYRLRLERRRIWPWVALGAGVLSGATFTGLLLR